MSAAKKRDTFFDLTMHGRLPEILREIAGRIEAGTVTMESFACTLEGDAVRINMNLDTAAKL